MLVPGHFDYYHSKRSPLPHLNIPFIPHYFDDQVPNILYADCVKNGTVRCKMWHKGRTSTIASPKLCT